MKLGICVAGRKNMHHVLGLARAAKVAGNEVQIFFTGEGVYLTQDPRVQELLQVASCKVCEVSYHANGFKGVEVPGIKYKDYVTQARNAEMVEECDRYVIL